jgi:hypothetical protein
MQSLLLSTVWAVACCEHEEWKEHRCHGRSRLLVRMVMNHFHQVGHGVGLVATWASVQLGSTIPHEFNPSVLFYPEHPE